MHRINIILVAIATSMLSIAYAEQTVIPNFRTTREKHFYGLYYRTIVARNATDIYCGIPFTVGPHKGKGLRGPNWLNIEHAYPAQWMADSLKCGDRKTCPQHLVVGKLFSHAEADMHNLWPASAELNSSRGKKPFGEIDEKIEYKKITIDQNAYPSTYSCDFKNHGGLVEPPANIRGDLARSIFYMCHEYNFRISMKMMPILRKWNREDPPTKEERDRASLIEDIQGTSNRFISDYSLGDAVICVSFLP